MLNRRTNDAFQRLFEKVPQPGLGECALACQMFAVFERESDFQRGFLVGELGGFL